MEIRKITDRDTLEWARMRSALWPSPLEEHLADIEKYFSGSGIDIVEIFVLDKGDGNLGGFIELNLRNCAEGSQSPRVPYVEGWFVDEDLRGLSYGKQLMEAAEAWAKEGGFHELASDAELENSHSIDVHKALGFEEAARIVCFIKRLD